MKYNITQSEQRYVYFRTAKCGTSSILNILRKNTKISVDEHNIEFDEIWNDYFKFTIVRNPWSRLLSCWLNKIVLEGKGVPGLEGCRYYRKLLSLHQSKYHTFADFIRCLNNDNNLYADKHWSPLQSLIKMDSVDFIGKLENLQADFNIICDKIGIPQQQLPHKNKTKHKHYTEYYDDETKQIVWKRYSKDIEYFGYEFGE